MDSLVIRPAVPPELTFLQQDYGESALENKTCIDFLRTNGIANGTLLSWAPPAKFSDFKAQRKKSSIYIPSFILGAKPIIIKFLTEMKDADNLVHQSFLQAQDLDRYIASIDPTRERLHCYFLFVVTGVKKNQKTEKQNEEKREDKIITKTYHLSEHQNIETFKAKFFSKCRALGFQILSFQAEHVTKTGNSNILSREEKKILMRIITDSTPKTFEHIENLDFALTNLRDSVPQYRYLELSDVTYNENEFEAKSGLQLKCLDGVVNVFLKLFGNCDAEICVWPDIDATPGSILDETSDRGFLNVSQTNGFLGEEVDFMEKVVGRLTKPKGFLIRRFRQTELNAVLKNSYTVLFEIDWIYFSHTKIYGIEVCRSDKPQNPKSAVERKLTSVLTKTMPKMFLILSSLLYNVDQNLDVERRIGFLDEIFEFVIYFTNVSAKEIEDSLENCEKHMEGAWKILQTVSANVLQKLSILCPDDATLDQKVPGLYKLINNGFSWKLQRSRDSLEEIFSGRLTSGSNTVADVMKQKLVIFSKAILSFGSLVQNFSINGPHARPLDWHCKIALKKAVFPNVILSPQQRKILNLPHRFIFLLGEPGTGKTLLLYAKALQAAEDPEVDHILFFLPDTKTEFKTKTDQFIEYCQSPNLQRKVTIAQFSDLDSTSKRLDLKRTIFLGDELYIDSVETYSDTDLLLLKTTNLFSWLPMLKACWFTKTEIGQDSKRKVFRVTLPQFHSATLNVLFRCSWHIGRFCTSVVHRNKLISKSTAWAYGCTTSSQHKVFYDHYSSLISLNSKIQTCQELRSKFDHDRITVIFTDTGNETDWNTRLSENRSKIGKIFVVNDRMGFYELPFTGIEKSSVLVIIDFCTWDDDEKIQQCSKLYNLAASRAQFELGILVRDSQALKLDTFLRNCEQTPFDEIVSSARLGLPLELEKVLLEDQNTNSVLERANLLFQIAVQRENKDLAQVIVEKIGSKNIDLVQFFICLDVPKTERFLTVLQSILGSDIKRKISTICCLSFLPAQKSLTKLIG